MKRREFIMVIAGAAASPAMVRAQQPAMPVIGYVINGNQADTPPQFSPR